MSVSPWHADAETADAVVRVLAGPRLVAHVSVVATPARKPRALLRGFSVHARRRKLPCSHDPAPCPCARRSGHRGRMYRAVVAGFASEGAHGLECREVRAVAAVVVVVAVMVVSVTEVSGIAGMRISR